MRKITIVNQSTVLKPADLPPVMSALQLHVDRDFTPRWGAHALLGVAPVGTDPKGVEKIYLLDNTDQANALGYHDFQAAEPVGFVFVKTTIDAGLQWSGTLCHELDEQLVDPFICFTTIAGSRAYALETDDAVESDSYQIKGVEMSNFVLPSWFAPGSHGPYDFLGLVKQPLQLRPGGYIGYTDDLKTWQQLTAAKVRVHKLEMHPWSRRVRRHSALGIRHSSPAPAGRRLL